MVAGALSTCGYFMGDNLYEARASNPKGFFESPEINGINEELLACVLPRRPPLIGRWCYRDRPAWGQRWLARVPAGTTITANPRCLRRIQAALASEPYCFKDPRFCYTLGAWRSAMPKTVFVCVFRHPAATARSILKECRDMPYLRSLQMDFDIALEVWRLMYEHVLRNHVRTGEWTFVHYEQMIDGSAVSRLEKHLDARIDRGFADASLRRSEADSNVPSEIRRLYQELCERAEFAGS